MSKYNYNESYFKNIHTENQAYWLGFLYADGCITRFYRNEKLKSMSLEITLQSEDVLHLEKFKKDLDCNVPVRHKIVSGKYHSDRLVINSTSMCRDLINLGCTPCKSLTLSFPDTSILPLKFIPHFIRGYFDGDGCIMNLKNHRLNSTFTSGSKDFLDTLHKVLKEEAGVLGGSYNPSNLSLCFGKKDTLKIGEYIYKDNPELFLLRKRNKFNII